MDTQELAKVLRLSPNNGVYHLPTSGREAMHQAAVDDELDFHLINLGDCDNIDDAFVLIGEAMHFPEWFGKNFDALHDCLTDLSWQESAASVIVFTGCDALHAEAPETWETLINVFLSAAEFWRDQEVPFWVFIDMRADGLAYLPTVA